MNSVALRNTAIILVLAGVGTVWRRGLSSLTFGLGQLVSVMFVAALIGFGIQYFRERRLAWLVLKGWQRAVIILAAGSAVFLAIFRLPAPRRPGHRPRRPGPDRGVRAADRLARPGEPALPLRARFRMRRPILKRALRRRYRSRIAERFDRMGPLPTTVSVTGRLRSGEAARRRPEPGRSRAPGA